ncbi:MAG: ABC transporter permease [Parafilimonas sp.]
MIKNYFKTAWRSLWKNKTISLINIIGLSVGITASVIILLWVQNELNFDNYHADENNIYRLTTTLKENNWTWESTALLMAEAAKKNIPEIDKIARINPDNQPVFYIHETPEYEKKCAYTDDAWFDIFHYDFIKGNAASFNQNPYSVILTESAARKYFGNGDALNATIRIDSNNYTVKAIIKNAPSNSSFQYDAFLPLSALLKNQQLKENDENWDNFNYITFVKLKPNANILAVSKKLTHLIPGNEKEETLISLTALKAMHFETGLQNSDFVQGNKNTVYIFSILAFVLLLVACINYVNLTTAKASLRAKEVSVKKIIGAKRTQLFYQFIIESLLVSFIVLITTLFLIQLCLPAFNSITNKHFQLSFTSASMWQVIGVTLSAAFILNSIYPALLLSSFKPLNVFRGFAVLKVKDIYFRKALVVMQFTISVILIAATIIIYKQLNFIQQKNPGYNKEQVVAFPLPFNVDQDKKAALIETIKHQLLTSGNILSVTASNQSIVNIGSMSTGSADWDGHDTTFNPKISQLSTDADFKNALQLQMQQGRWFQQGSVADKNNVILNETAVKELRIHQPVLAQRFTFKGRTGQIIGVVKDFNYQSMHNKTGSLIAFNDPSWFRFFMVRIAPGSAQKSIADIQNIWKQFFPDAPLEYNFLDDSFNELYKQDQQASFLIFVFAFVAIAISSLGLFGLAAFSAEQRNKEIGIRKVLGASITGIIGLLSKDFLKLILIAFVIATPLAAIAMNKWLQAFAYRINVTWWMFALSGLLAILIAIVTISFQSIKAAIANPVKSLRTE